MRLKELRQERGLTQMDVANGIDTGQSNIRRWEIGEVLPSSEYVIKLANFFQVSSDYLLGLEDDFGLRVPEVINSAEHYSKDEKELIEKYRHLDPRIKKLIRDQVDIYSERSELLPKKENKI